MGVRAGRRADEILANGAAWRSRRRRHDPLRARALLGDAMRALGSCLRVAGPSGSSPWRRQARAGSPASEADSQPPFRPRSTGRARNGCNSGGGGGGVATPSSQRASKSYLVPAGPASFRYLATSLPMTPEERTQLARPRKQAAAATPATPAPPPGPGGRSLSRWARRRAQGAKIRRRHRVSMMNLQSATAAAPPMIMIFSSAVVVAAAAATLTDGSDS